MYIAQFLLAHKMLPLNIQSKWEKEVHKGVVIEDYDWSCIYCIPFSVTKDTKLLLNQGPYICICRHIYNISK
jgi:hypothetical protein